MSPYIRKSKEERKREICHAGIKVFSEKGFRNTTMEDIVEETSLSKGGVYQYYKSTRDVLMDIMRLGNAYRMGVYKKLEDNFDENIPFKEAFVNYALSKLYDEKPLMDLYSMFIAEIIYDEKIKALFYQIEREAFGDIMRSMEGKISEDERKMMEERYLFISRIINGLIFIDYLFREQKILLLNKEKVIEILKVIVE